MIEESNNEPTTEKLSIDNRYNFKFHAAYLTYSDAYDKAPDAETKKELNKNIIALQQNQIDYSTFYEKMEKYRQDVAPQQHRGRTLIKTQRKREWHRKMQKKDRNERHRK